MKKSVSTKRTTRNPSAKIGQSLTSERFVLDRTTLPEQVAQKIETMILSDVPEFAGKLPSEQSLATAFSVSRTVIREAMVILRARGLILKTNGTNAKICDRPSVNLENMLKLMVRMQNITPREIYEVRCALETMAVALAASKHTSEDVKCLEALVGEMEKNRDNVTLRADADLKFHRKVITMSGNIFLVSLSDSLFTLLTPIVREVLENFGVTDDAVVMHNRVIDAIRKSDPDAAADAMRIHLALFIRNLEIGQKNFEKRKTNRGS